MNDYQAIGALAPQPSGLDVELDPIKREFIEEPDPIKRAFPDEGIIFAILQRLPDGDKINFAIATPYTKEVAYNNRKFLPLSQDKVSMDVFYKSLGALKQAYTKYRYYERLNARCPGPIYDDRDNNCFDVIFRLLAFSPIPTFAGSVSCGVSAGFKSCGACGGCVGTKISCGIASGATCGAVCLLGLITLGLYAPTCIKNRQEGWQEEITTTERNHATLTQRFNKTTQFKPLPEQQPALLKMNENDAHRERIHKDYSTPPIATERSKLIPGHMRMSDE